MSRFPIEFPVKHLIPGSAGFSLIGVGSQGGTGESIGGVRQYVGIGSTGTWVGRLEDIVVFYGPQFLELRNFLAKLRSPAGTFLCPTFDNHNIKAAGKSTCTQKQTRLPAAPGATVIYIEDYTTSEDTQTIRSAMRFSTKQGRLYEVQNAQQVDVQTGVSQKKVYEVEVWPPIKETIPLWTCLDFENPHVEVRLVNYNEILAILEHHKRGVFTFNVIEK